METELLAIYRLRGENLMAEQMQTSNKNIQIALFVMVIVLIGVVVWEEVRLVKAVELCQAFIESVSD